MFLQVNGLEISNLNKANENTVTVDIIANHLTEDSEGEMILKEAFNEEAVNSFLDTGIIDYWHESHNPHLSKEEQNAAIIGKPVAFRWENGKPVVTAQLTKSHRIVKEMLPHLEAEQSLYAASVGGSKMVLEANDSTNKKHKIIPKIKWDHLAIAPSPYVINRAPGMNVKLLQKANDLMFEFNTMSDFQRNFTNCIEKEEILKKALTAPESAGALYSEPGGSVTKQSLENKLVNLTFNENDGLDLIDTIINIKNIPKKKEAYLKHFEKQGKKDFGDKSYRLIDKYFKSKGAKK